MTVMLITLAAVDAGLASGFAGTPVPREHPGAQGRAGHPRDFVPVGVMPVGHPLPDKRSPSLKRGWVPSAAFARWERWGEEAREGASSTRPAVTVLLRRRPHGRACGGATTSVGPGASSTPLASGPLDRSNLAGLVATTVPDQSQLGPLAEALSGADRTQVNAAAIGSSIPALAGDPGPGPPEGPAAAAGEAGGRRRPVGPAAARRLAARGAGIGATPVRRVAGQRPRRSSSRSSAPPWTPMTRASTPRPSRSARTSPTVRAASTRPCG